jgi:hypothetical protein
MMHKLAYYFWCEVQLETVRVLIEKLNLHRPIS